MRCHARLALDRDLDEPAPGFDSIREALEDLAAGKFLVVLDDEDRENEGDLIIAADKAGLHPRPERACALSCCVNSVCREPPGTRPPFS